MTEIHPMDQMIQEDALRSEPKGKTVVYGMESEAAVKERPARKKSEAETIDEVKLSFRSRSQNERFSRTVVAAFVARLDPTLEEISDLKTAVSEAVTNAIIHAYSDENGMIDLTAEIKGNDVVIEIRDYGVGIPDIKQAMEPTYTTRPEWERSGMGFAFMEAFTDELRVDSATGEGTRIRMRKRIGGT